MDLRGKSIEDVAFIVCSAMERAGVTVVLGGGGAATFYAPAAYRTRLRLCPAPVFRHAFCSARP